MHHGIKVKCKECDFESKWDYDLEAHVNSVHENIKYPCMMCDFQTLHSSILKRHYKVHAK